MRENRPEARREEDSRRASVCFGEQQIDGLHQLTLGLATDALKNEPFCIANGPFLARR